MWCRRTATRSSSLPPPAGASSPRRWILRLPHRRGGCAAAIDLGTTTTALRLYDLATGRVAAACADWNAQAAYGADVISRIQYTREQPDGLSALSGCIRAQVESLLTQALAQTNREARELKRVVLAGNTVMQLLFAGISVEPLAAAPFQAETLFRQPVQDTLLGAPVHYLPCAAGYVGGDITAGLLASGLAGQSRAVPVSGHRHERRDGPRRHR